jgi:tellurite resistance-related uncharacterized protein
MESIPDQCNSYKKTPVFGEISVPVGLLKAHKTKIGTWGKIVVLEGQLLYRILEPIFEEHVLDSDHPGVVEPEVLHVVEPQGKVSFYVDFHKQMAWLNTHTLLAKD